MKTTHYVIHQILVLVPGSAARTHFGSVSRAMSYRTLAYARYFKAYHQLINELFISKVFNLHKPAISYASP